MVRSILQLLRKIFAIAVATAIVLLALFALTSLSDMTIGDILFSFRLPVTPRNIEESRANVGLGADKRRDPSAPMVLQEDTPQPKLTIGLVSDSGGEHEKLEKALNALRQSNVDLVIGLGDYTTVGTADELAAAKTAFEESGLSYYVLPGDHDLWDGRNDGIGSHAYVAATFEFRPNSQMYQEITANGTSLILIDNADNEVGLAPEQWNWLNSILAPRSNGATFQSGAFVFLHKPIYHPTSEHIMGQHNESVAEQAQELRRMLADAGVALVTSGDLHFFAEYPDDPYGTSMVTIGALATERNPQAPRFAILRIFGDNTWAVDDIEIVEN